MTPWDHRFFTSTRGQLVMLLRRSAHTVEELAKTLGLTYNGVRAHLAVLERDQIVQQQGVVRQGSGKPAYLYELIPAAENLFPKAYGPVLHQLLDVLNEQVGYEQSEALLRRVGRRMAGERVAAADSARARLEEAVATLNELGGFAELDEHNTGFIIRSYSCPLYTMVRDHPKVCRIVETLLSELTGIPVHEHCDRGDRPRCCFEVTSSFGDTT